MKFWIWLQIKLGIKSINETQVEIKQELSKLRKKVSRKPQTYGEIERARSQKQHPKRH